jgi:transcriptional regulator with XRE-family HTH domain
MGNVKQKNGKSTKPVESNPYKEIGERLKWIFRGESPYALEKRIGVSNTTIQRYYDGEAFPKNENMLKAVHARGFSVDWLLFNIGAPTLAVSSVELTSPELLADFLSAFPNEILGAALRKVGAEPGSQPVESLTR